MSSLIQTWLRKRRDERKIRLETMRRREEAMQRALAHFQKRHTTRAMGAHILCDGPQETIVRVMYRANHIPPDRAWYAVPRNASELRVLSFDDVAALETPWR